MALRKTLQRRRWHQRDPAKICNIFLPLFLYHLDFDLCRVAPALGVVDCIRELHADMEGMHVFRRVSLCTQYNIDIYESVQLTTNVQSMFQVQLLLFRLHISMHVGDIRGLHI